MWSNFRECELETSLGAGAGGISVCSSSPGAPSDTLGTGWAPRSSAPARGGPAVPARRRWARPSPARPSAPPAVLKPRCGRGPGAAAVPAWPRCPSRSSRSCCCCSAAASARPPAPGSTSGKGSTATSRPRARRPASGELRGPGPPAEERWGRAGQARPRLGGFGGSGQGWGLSPGGRSRDTGAAAVTPPSRGPAGHSRPRYETQWNPWGFWFFFFKKTPPRPALGDAGVASSSRPPAGPTPARTSTWTCRRCRRAGTGGTWMGWTTPAPLGTSTSPSTAGPAGPTAAPAPWQVRCARGGHCLLTCRPGSPLESVVFGKQV